MSSWSRLVALVGGSCLAIAAATVFTPWLLPTSQSQLVSLMDDLSTSVGIAGLALLAVGISAVQGLWSSTTPSSPPAMPVDAGESTVEGGMVVGKEFDERLAAAERVGSRVTKAEAMVQEDLRRLAIDVYQQVNRCDWSTAARAIEEGRWTDDPSVAAFVGGPDAPEIPLGLWFRDMLSENGAFYQQTTRTISEIYRLQAETDVSVSRIDGDRNGDADAGGDVEARLDAIREEVTD